MAERNREYRITRINADGETLKKAAELGIRENGKISLEKKFFCGGIIVNVDGSRYALGRAFLYAIEVRE
ncbi:MAG: ferrous iron transport protein A [Clostridia bacterium]|nr:ferrous iron transport protein A [Clostridia bacterium]